MTLTRMQHPSDVELRRHAGGDEEDRASARVATHIEACADCRATVTFMRELTTAARALPEMTPPAGVLERVMAERAAGSRTTLPVRDAVAFPRSRYVWIASAAAAAIVAFAVGTQIGTGGEGRPAMDADPDAPDLSWIFPTSAFAQTPIAAAGRAAVPPIRDLDGSRLRPGRWTYRRAWRRNGVIVKSNSGTVALDETTHAGIAVWRTAHRWIGDGAGSRPLSETTYVARRSLEPISSEQSIPGRYHVAQRFARDSVFSVLSEHGRTVATAATLPASLRPYAADGFAPLMLAAVQLRGGWTGRFTIVGHEGQTIPVDLRVAGTERVTVPAGTFDCWRLIVTVEGRELTLWARTRDGLAIRSLDPTSSSGVVIETVLQAEETPQS